MISYELAQRLKDAGFPQKPTYLMVNCLLTEELQKSLVVIPTLSELIEAVKKQDEDERNFVLWFGGTEWHAAHTNYATDDYIDDYPSAESGSTPEEAVALLYLKINNKS